MDSGGVLIDSRNQPVVSCLLGVGGWLFANAIVSAARVVCLLLKSDITIGNPSLGDRQAPQ